MQMAPKRARARLTKKLQISIFRRDGWLCCWCKKPVIFAPAMKYVEREVRTFGHEGRLAYYHAHWTRDGSPLLDELGAVIDHVEAFSSGGPCIEENLVTACSKCNVRKSAFTVGKWKEKPQRAPVKGKYGEPQNWDGLSTLFLVLARRADGSITAAELEWVKALEEGNAQLT